MINRWTLSALFFALLLVACGGNTSSPITPAPDRPTFMYFYTDGWTAWERMEPVVNGLEAKFDTQIAFIRVDAASQDGQTAFRAYRLQGHPSYALIGPRGDVLWTGIGEQPGGNLEKELIAVLGNP